MRFDDRLTTLLATEPRDSADRAARWAQLADVYAQSASALPAEVEQHIAERLALWARDVPAARKGSVAAAVSMRQPPAPLVEIFALEAPQIAAPVLMRAALPGSAWQELIHHMPPASRNLLRQRRDLPVEAQRTLALYARADLALDYVPGGARSGGEAPAIAEPIQIRDLVARIEAYRRDHPIDLPKLAVTEPAARFRFETRADGVIAWVSGVDRAALIGLDLNEALGDAMAAPLKAGDNFEGARLFIGGSGDAAGWWTVSGKAVGSGGIGFRCLARRAAAEPRQTLLAGAFAPDSVRQLAHELRTPLNAIRGFADMISGQFLGPVAGAYRQRAAEIAIDAARLAALIDDLDVAARIDSDAFERLGQARCDAGQLLRRVAGQLRGTAEARDLVIQMSVPSALPEAGLSESDAERLISRFLGALTGAADHGSQIRIALGAERSGLALSVGRPAPLIGMADAELRRSAIGAEMTDGPPLGFGFALRLAEAHAQACGGQILICEDRFDMILPVAAGSQFAAAATG